MTKTKKKMSMLGSWDIMGVLVPKILKYRSGDIVEIGMGESTGVLAKCAEEEGVTLYSCDIVMGGRDKYFKKKLFLNHICYIGKSEDFIKEYDGYPAIVFIDGDHKYTTVRMEVEFFLPRIIEGGVMFLHDTMPYLEIYTSESLCGNAYKIRQDLELNTDVDVFTWPYSAIDAGLTMVMKHDKNRPYWRMNGRDFD